MIRPAEIQKKANSEKVRDTQIEKDYVIVLDTARHFEATAAVKMYRIQRRHRP